MIRTTENKALIAEMIDNCANLLADIEQESKLINRLDSDLQADMIAIIEIEKSATRRLSAALQEIRSRN